MEEENRSSTIKKELVEGDLSLAQKQLQLEEDEPQIIEAKSRIF